MGWAFVWMMVVLKLPIVALLYIVWWAMRQEPLPEDEPADSGTGGGGTPHPRGPRPRPPRRGEHGQPPPRSPRRVRAHSRKLSRQVHR